MGAYDFSCISEGKDAAEAFKSAISQAQYEYGHNGRTGTIAEKSSYVMVGDSWKDVKARYAKAVKELNKILIELNKTEAGEYSRAYLVDQLEGMNIPLWLQLNSAHTKSSALKFLRAKIKELRALRDSCKRGMDADELVDHLMNKLCDERIDGISSPAGCVDLQPKVKGIRKRKKFLFFGVASA